jgi:hypothetical protein
MLVVQRRFARLRREVTRASHELCVVGHQHSAATGGDDFIAIEGKHGDLRLATRGLSAIASAKRLGRVLHHWDRVTFTQLGDGAVVGTLAVQIDGDDGLR